MPMHSMEAWPSHSATEGALGGRGGKKGGIFHPASTKLTGTKAFGDLFYEIVRQSVQSQSRRAVRAGVQGKVSSQSGFIS